MSAAGMMWFIIIFPILYFILLASDTFVYLYNPVLRIGSIVAICSLYFWYATHKKYTKRQNDFLENLSLQRGNLNNLEYFYTTMNNNKMITISTWIEGVYGYDFSLKFEGRFERFFKKIGFNTECQTGEKRFDKMIYIVSDNEWLCNELKHNEELRKSFYDIFWCYDKHNFDITKISCFDGRLFVTSMLEHDENETVDDSLIHSFTHELASLMQKAIAHLPSKQTIDDRLYREKTSCIAFSFYIIIVGLVVNGVILFLADFTHHSMLVSSIDIFSLSLKIAVFIFTLLFGLVWILLRQSSRLLPVLFVLFTSGILGILSTTLVEVKEVNFFLDNSVADAIPTKIYKKEIRKGKRDKKMYYYVHLYDWKRQNRLYTTQITQELFSQIDEGEHAIVFQRKGFLGYPWIEDIKISRK